MKAIANVAGLLLGLIFAVTSLNYFFHFFEMPAPPDGSPAALFMGALVPTGYFTFIKVLEFTGAILVAIPATRRLGLMALGPIVVNILCFHVFLEKGAGLFPLPLLVAALSLFLLWAERAAFSQLLPRHDRTTQGNLSQRQRAQPA